MIAKMLYFFVFLILFYFAVQTLYTWFYFNKSQNLIKNVFVGKRQVGERNKAVFKISIYGDSVGAGVGATSFETSLAGRIANYYSYKFFVEIINLSVVGNKMAHVLKNKIPDEKQDLIVLVVSSNNLFRLTNLKQFEKDTQAVLKKFTPRANKFVLIGPGRIVSSPAVPLFFKPVYACQGPKYAAILAEVSLNYPNVTYVNPLEPPSESKQPQPNTWAADNFHPNNAGHEYWFDLIKNALD